MRQIPARLRACLSLALLVLSATSCAKTATPVAPPIAAPIATAATDASSTLAIDGVPAATVTGAQVEAALDKAGWVHGGAMTNNEGSQEILNVTATRPALKALVSIQRPRDNPSGTAGHGASPEEQRDYFAKRGAARLMGNVVVGVVVKDADLSAPTSAESLKAESEKLLAALVGG